MAYMNRFNQSDEGRRDELIRIIEHSVEKLTLAELEALYYDMTTKSYINEWELYIPAEMGYGKFSQPGIPGGSTLIFEIELLGIA